VSPGFDSFSRSGHTIGHFLGPLLKVRPRVFVSTESEEEAFFVNKHKTWVRRYRAPPILLTDRHRVGREPRWVSHYAG